MNIEQARTLVERQARAWEHADLDAIPADFAPDGWFISPGGRWQGRDAVRSAAEAFFREATDVKIKITRVLINGDQGAAEWTWSEVRRSNGRRYSMEDAIIFVVRDDKIIYWREYFDTAELRD
jgi:uncharacterized protein (TIGR02246 family)